METTAIVGAGPLSGRGATGPGASERAEAIPRLPDPLIQAAMAGDQAALLGLLEAARPNIRRYARAACRVDDVDDAIQEALWLLYRRIGALRAASAFSAWLFSIVRRECLRMARRAGFASASAGIEAREVIVRPDAELRLELADAIGSLPPHYRAVIVMRDIEERTVEEMTQALGLTREAVKGRLHRARALLREYLI